MNKTCKIAIVNIVNDVEHAHEHDLEVVKEKLSGTTFEKLLLLKTDNLEYRGIIKRVLHFVPVKLMLH